MQVRQVKEGIESVPDGVHTQRKPYGVGPVFLSCSAEYCCDHVIMSEMTNCFASGACIVLHGVCVQRMIADTGRGKGKQEIIIDATQRDLRMDNDANYYAHTDATKQFRQARKFCCCCFDLPKCCSP